MRTALLSSAVILAPLYASADFKVSETRDTIVLRDGKEIQGIVLASGRKGLVVVVENADSPEEIFVPRERIKAVIEKGFSPKTTAFTTDPQEGVKVVSGEGFRDADGKPPAGNIPPTKPAAKPSGKKQKTARKPSPRSRGPKITAKTLRQLAAKDPRVKTFINMVGGADKAAALLNDPDQRRKLRETARKMNIELPISF